MCCRAEGFGAVSVGLVDWVRGESRPREVRDVEVLDWIRLKGGLLGALG